MAETDEAKSIVKKIQAVANVGVIIAALLFVFSLSGLLQRGFAQKVRS